jgi:hypothetical protein
MDKTKLFRRGNLHIASCGTWRLKRARPATFPQQAARPKEDTMNKKVLICATAVPLLFFMQGVAQSNKHAPAKNSTDKKVDAPEPGAAAMNAPWLALAPWRSHLP